MAIRVANILNAKHYILKRSSSLLASQGIPKGYLAVYVGEKEKKRYVVPISLLNNPLFQELLSQSVEEFGYEHPMGGLTIPCREDVFVDIASRFSG